MSILSKEGFGALRFSFLVFIVGVGVAIFLAGGSYIYWQAEKGNSKQSLRTLNDMQSRLSNAKRERDDLRNSEDTFKALTARGVFVTERRLDLLDAMEALKNRHQINTLEYEMSAQRPLKLAGGTSINAIEALGSRIRFKATALHDADLVAFLDEFPRMQRGLFQIDRCVFKRETNSTANTAPKTSTAGEDVVGSAIRLLRPTSVADNADTLPPAKQTTSIEAECSLEWITLVDKRTLAPTASTTSPSSNAAGAGR
jgi:hypothetical protein